MTHDSTHEGALMKILHNPQHSCYSCRKIKLDLYAGDESAAAKVSLRPTTDVFILLKQ